MENLYLWLVFAALVVLTAVVMFFASRSVSRHNKQTREALAEIKRLKALKDEYQNLTSEQARSAEPSELLDGCYAVLEAKLEAADDADKLFSELPESQQNIYALYCFLEDCEQSLSFYFKNNDTVLQQKAVPSVKAIGYAEILPAVEAVSAMYDETREDVSLDDKDIAQADSEFENLFSKEKFLLLTKDYIAENSAI